MAFKFQLKDGSFTTDIRLDRVEQFDSRSRSYPLCSATDRLEKPLRSYTWRCHPRLDQGHEGSCVGHAIAHELAARPSEVPMSHQYARETIYWDAQRIDPWPGGAYPGAAPFYEGTSVLAGVKVAHKLGWFDSYRWAFGLRDLQLGVGYNGPAVLGLPWYEGMFWPDHNGYIHPEGRKVGGHAILCNAINVKEGRFTLHNSWSGAWGMNGECFITFADMDRLLRERGEAVFMIKRHRKNK